MTQLSYTNAKIYKLEPLQEHEEYEIFVGSTCYKYLSKSMRNYRTDYERYKRMDCKDMNKSNAFPLFEKYGIDNIQILLIESYPCSTKDELKARIAYHIKSLKCMNRIVPLRKIKEYREDNKDKYLEYRGKNKDKIKVQQKEYHENNREKINERRKQYYKNNHEQLLEKARKYREENIEKFKEYDRKPEKLAYNSELIICDCGFEYRRDCLSRHKKTILHTKRMVEIDNDKEYKKQTENNILVQSINNNLEETKKCDKCNIELVHETKDCECHKCENWGGCEISHYYILRCPKCYVYVNTNNILDILIYNNEKFHIHPNFHIIIY
jgi:hypothetical protein